jgi:hypothetical protein
MLLKTVLLTTFPNLGRGLYLSVQVTSFEVFGDRAELHLVDILGLNAPVISALHPSPNLPKPHISLKTKEKLSG